MPGDRPHQPQAQRCQERLESPKDPTCWMGAHLSRKPVPNGLLPLWPVKPAPENHNEELVGRPRLGKPALPLSVDGNPTRLSHFVRMSLPARVSRSVYVSSPCRISTVLADPRRRRLSSSCPGIHTGGLSSSALAPSSSKQAFLLPIESPRRGCRPHDWLPVGMRPVARPRTLISERFDREKAFPDYISRILSE